MLNIRFFNTTTDNKRYSAVHLNNKSEFVLLRPYICSVCIVDALPRVWGTGDQGLLGESMGPRLAEYILSFTMGLDSSEVKRFFFVFLRSVAVKRDLMLVTSSCNLKSNMGEGACPETENYFLRGITHTSSIISISCSLLTKG